MFNSLPQHFRDYGLQADIRTLMLLRRSIERGLVNTLGDLYLVLKGIITHDPKDYGPYTVAFYKYFLNIDIKEGEMLESAIARSEAFKEWGEQRAENREEREEEDLKELIEAYLNEIHLTTYDIQEILSGGDILRNDDPSRADGPADQPDQMPGQIDRMADYQDIPLEELLERMKEVMRQQQRAHKGGNHWVGQGGVSPYGNQGAAKGGVRVGGGGGGKMARKVIGDKNFYPVDLNESLKDDNIDVALAYLKGIEDESAQQFLDIQLTIKEGAKEGGLFLPYETEKIEQKVQVILMIDNGGWSMSPYTRLVTKLFSKMKRRFAHELETYYYHNTIYGGLFTDVRRTQYVSLDKVLKEDKNYSVFIIGDADMAPYELTRESEADWQRIKDRFKRAVWLNPMTMRYWAASDTVNRIRQILPMFPLTPAGIEKAVELMNKKRRFAKR